MNYSPCNDAFKTTDIVGGRRPVFDILNDFKVCVLFLFQLLLFPLTVPFQKKKKINPPAT